MTLVYADTSALARAYLTDEVGHEQLRTLLFESDYRVVTSELARIELASAIVSASRTGRTPGWEEVLATMEADTGPAGMIALIALRRELILPAALRLVAEHRLRTLDAIHLAVAMEEGPRLAAGDEIQFVTLDRDQAAAARALGLTVR
ncbi:MAG: type II toxin-antitoxin system VapC family toxin [Chloroflexota bacterium]|nr:type II toxin-antitoxin system VapC family toxin [Chloroflexota bacterium]